MIPRRPLAAIAVAALLAGAAALAQQPASADPDCSKLPDNPNCEEPTTTTESPTTTTQPPSTTEPSTTTTQPPGNPPDFFQTLPVGAALPSGVTCASRVDDAPENRTRNAVYNATIGTSPHDERPRVDGNFTGSTDEILQWVACKWGINEDLVRAQAITESYWFQETGGDKTTNLNSCAPAYQQYNPCPESVGILQVRWNYHRPAFEDENSIRSTAYNADYAYSSWRACMEGEYGWLNTVEHGRTYPQANLTDQVWGCLGVWFAGRWYTAPATQYIAAVQGNLTARVWETPGFAGATCSSCYVPGGTPPPTTTTTTTTGPTTTTTGPATTTTSTTTTTTQPPSSGDYLETFETAASLNGFDFFVHAALQHSDTVFSFLGDHNHACEGPDTTRLVQFPALEGVYLTHDPGETVWWCAPGGPSTGHLMTGFNTSGYAQVDFAPARTFSNVRRVCWDQNMTDLGPRKWTQMLIVPETTFQANDARLDYVIPGLGDVVAGGILFPSSNFFGLQILKGSTTTFPADDHNFIGFTVPDKARRFKTCVSDNNNGTVRIELERLNSTEVRTMAGTFPNGSVRVIFQDDNYDPDKAAPSGIFPFYTFHWDNVLVDVD